MKKTKKTAPKINKTEVKVCEQISGVLRWFDRASGRFQKLVEIKAPLVILHNELNLWNSMVSKMGSLLASGHAALTDEGKETWRDALAEYGSLPSYAELRLGYEKQSKDDELIEECVEAHVKNMGASNILEFKNFVS